MNNAVQQVFSVPCYIQCIAKYLNSLDCSRLARVNKRLQEIVSEIMRKSLNLEDFHYHSRFPDNKHLSSQENILEFVALTHNASKNVIKPWVSICSHEVEQFTLFERILNIKGELWREDLCNDGIRLHLIGNSKQNIDINGALSFRWLRSKEGIDRVNYMYRTSSHSKGGSSIIADPTTHKTIARKEDWKGIAGMDFFSWRGKSHLCLLIASTKSDTFLLEVIAWEPEATASESFSNLHHLHSFNATSSRIDDIIFFDNSVYIRLRNRKGSCITYFLIKYEVGQKQEEPEEFSLEPWPFSNEKVLQVGMEEGENNLLLKINEIELWNSVGRLMLTHEHAYLLSAENKCTGVYLVKEDEIVKLNELPVSLRCIDQTTFWDENQKEWPLLTYRTDDKLELYAWSGREPTMPPNQIAHVGLDDYGVCGGQFPRLWIMHKNLANSKGYLSVLVPVSSGDYLKKSMEKQEFSCLLFAEKHFSDCNLLLWTSFACVGVGFLVWKRWRLEGIAKLAAKR